MVDSSALLEQCAPRVSTQLMHALVRVESAWRPLAIGMDAGESPVRQPQTVTQAVAQAKALVAAGRGFSVGLAQIHVGTVRRYGLSWEQAFDPCLNLAAGQRVLQDFYRGATAEGYAGSAAVQAALRGYNAGAIDRVAGDRYARRVVALAHDLLPAGQAKPHRPTVDPAMQLRFSAQTGELSRDAESSGFSSSLGEASDIFAKKSAAAGF